MADKDRVLCWVVSQTLSSHQPLSSAALPMLEYGSNLTPKAPRTQLSSAQHSSDSASVSPSASNSFHPGLHQMFLTSVHPPIPPERLAL